MNSLQYRQLARRVDILEALVAQITERLLTIVEEHTAKPLQKETLHLPNKTIQPLKVGLGATGKPSPVNGEDVA